MRTNRRSSALLVLFALVSSGFAQQTPKTRAVENATTALLQMNASYRQAPAAQKSQAAAQLGVLAAQRQQLLSSLIQTNPADVLRFAIPNNIRSTMPPAVQNLVEQTVQRQGVCEVVVEDSTAGARVHFGLITAAGRLSLHFAGQVPRNLLTGSIIKAVGVQVGTDLALACCTSTATSALQTVQSILPNTFGTQSTLVMLVNFQDNTSQPYTLTTAHDVVFNQTSNWDLENSLQQTSLTGTVVGWYTLPMTSSTCDYTSIATYANQAATAAGIDLSAYKHYVYAFPNLSACGWWGLGTVGGSPSQAWINGSIALKVVGHEMGHNFGLYHSHSSSCGTTQTLCPTPTISDYGDSIDEMGSPSAGHFNAFQKERLGWLNYGISAPITPVQSNGNYSIGPFENQDATPKALKILQSTNATTGANTWYYVEFRQAAGFDSFLSNDANVTSGVLVHTGTDNDGNSSELLNMAPSLGNFYTSALDVGQSFIDPISGITLKTLSANTSGATVSVVFGTPVCAHFNPTVSISPYQSQTVAAGATVSYTVTVLNNDNAGCSASTFNLSASLPAGWAAGYSSATVTLSPGTSAGSTLQVTSPSTAATGIYSVTAGGANAGSSNFAATASGTYVLNTLPCVNANPTVTLSPAQNPSVQPGTTVTYVIAVKNNDNSSCNSSTFRLSDSVPTGWTATLGVSSSSLTIAAGAQASTSLNVTSPATATGGSYNLSGSALNTTYASSNYSGTASATYVVAGGSTCTHSNPTVTMSPAQSASVAAGTPVNFLVVVKNNDSAACSTSNFNLSANLLTGWSGAWNNPGIFLAPGNSGSATLTVSSPIGLANGSYSVGGTATNASAPSYLGSATAIYSAATTGTISVGTNSLNYAPGQTVTISVTVLAGGNPVPGANVSVSVISPKGTAFTLTGVTGTNGMITLSYKLRKQALAGVYQVQATSSAVASSALAAASTTFTVQ